MPASHRLGELQLAIMEILWRGGPAGVAEVHDALRPQRRLAPTTVATMLRKMEDKGVVTHREEGRRFIYRPAVQRDDVHRTMVGDLVERLFGGDATKLVSHLLTEGDIDRADLDALRKRLARHHKESGENKP